ncbi:HSP70-domain-containing protein [Neoconidiobolus thromboides FSU 785]|nr:HSP70-domain-containing protein [Neoconidiobolus thromboides FSU 785]
MSNQIENDRSAVVGLTIGSLYSSVAVIDKDGRPNVIANEDGERLIPTCVAFRGDEIFAGSQAHNQAVRNPKNTLYNFFDLLGNDETNEIVSSLKAKASYKLITKDSQLGYEVEYKEKATTFTAHEIAVHFFKVLKETALTFISTQVSATVIAVPIYYTEEQRKKITLAANEAGLNVEQIVNEPSAALLAYDSFDKLVLSDKTVITFDLGANSLDISLLSAKQGVYTLLSSLQDREVSGLALDQLLVQHFMKEFKTKSKIDITDNQRALAKLRVGCELTKKTLASTNSAPCSIESLAEGVDYHGTINRLRFEMMASKLFNKAIASLEKAIETAGYHVIDIDEVILIGGGSRIPKLQNRIRDLFPESTSLRLEIETDEAVSRGCVMQSLLLKTLHETEDINLDTLAKEEGLSNAQHLTKPIGILDGDNKFVKLIPQDTPLPLRRIFRFENNEESAFVQVFEGEKEATTIQPETPEKDDDDDDEPETPEPYTVYSYKAGKLVAEVGIDGLNNESAVELQIQIDEQCKLNVLLRDLKSGKNSVASQ